MSTTFTDDNGREWRIHLTLGKVKEINEMLGHDLLAPFDGKVIDAVTKDIRHFAEVMAMAVKFDDQADPAEQGEALADGLRGEGLDRAIVAFWKELSCFFVGRQRAAFLTLISKGLEVWDALWTNGIRQASMISAETLNSMFAAPLPPQDAPTNPEVSGS